MAIRMGSAPLPRRPPASRQLLLLPQLAALLLPLLLLLAARPADAYPWFYSGAGGSCTAHPAAGFGSGKHTTGAAVLDTAITLQVSNTSGAQTTLCQGGQYTVTLGFPDARLAMLTASDGAFAGSTACPNRANMGSAATSWTRTLTVPCAGSSMTLKTTTSSSQSVGYSYNSQDLTVDAGCIQASCSTTTGAAAVADKGTRSCPASSLGYQCSTAQARARTRALPRMAGAPRVHRAVSLPSRNPP